MKEPIEQPDDGLSRRDRAVVFTDSSSPHAQLLTAALLAAAQDVEGLAIAAVVDTGTVAHATFLLSFDRALKRTAKAVGTSLASVRQQAGTRFTFSEPGDRFCLLQATDVLLNSPARSRTSFGTR